MDYSKITALLNNTLHRVAVYLDEHSLPLLLLVGMVCIIHFSKEFFIGKLRLDDEKLKFRLVIQLLNYFNGSRWLINVADDIFYFRDGFSEYRIRIDVQSGAPAYAMQPTTARRQLLEHRFIVDCVNALPEGTVVLKSPRFHNSCAIVTQFQEHYVVLHVDLIGLQEEVERPRLMRELV